jgi:membrane protease subunit (stomatin/prohibitin family)
MGFIHHEVSREFIAMPDTAKDQIVFKWPDINIRRGGRAIVDADQSAVFLAKGEVAGLLGPGQHHLEATEIPFLGILIDHASDGNAYRTEIYFVGTREYTGDGFTFGGQVDSVQDPQTGMIVTLRVFGNYAMKVADPAKLILKLTGTVNVEDNSSVTDWVSNQLLKVIRTEVTSQIVRNGWPILGLAAYTPDLESATLSAGNTQLADYGVELSRLGNFNINLSDDDEAALKGLAKDTAYSRLAGSFGQYAQGEALLGAGEGMAKGGGAGTQSAFHRHGHGHRRPDGTAGTARPHPAARTRLCRRRRRLRTAALGAGCPRGHRRRHRRSQRQLPVVCRRQRGGRQVLQRVRLRPAHRPVLLQLRHRDGPGRPLLLLLRHGGRRGRPDSTGRPCPAR